MKKLIIILFVLFTFNSYSQLKVTIQLRSYCTYHFEGDTLSDCISKPEDSVFIISADESEIYFTVDNNTNIYYVMGTSHQHYGIFTYRVVSDMNNEYILIFDLKKGYVVALMMNEYCVGDKEIKAVRFRIKEII